MSSRIGREIFSFEEAESQSPTQNGSDLFDLQLQPITYQPGRKTTIKILEFFCLDDQLAARLAQKQLKLTVKQALQQDQIFFCKTVKNQSFFFHANAQLRPKQPLTLQLACQAPNGSEMLLSQQSIATATISQGAFVVEVYSSLPLATPGTAESQKQPYSPQENRVALFGYVKGGQQQPTCLLIVAGAIHWPGQTAKAALQLRYKLFDSQAFVVVQAQGLSFAHRKKTLLDDCPGQKLVTKFLSQSKAPLIFEVWTGSQFLALCRIPLPQCELEKLPLNVVEGLVEFRDVKRNDVVLKVQMRIAYESADAVSEAESSDEGVFVENSNEKEIFVENCNKKGGFTTYNEKAAFVEKPESSRRATSGVIKAALQISDNIKKNVTISELKYLFLSVLEQLRKTISGGSQIPKSLSQAEFLQKDILLGCFDWPESQILNLAAWFDVLAEEGRVRIDRLTKSYTAYLLFEEAYRSNNQKTLQTFLQGFDTQESQQRFVQRLLQASRFGLVERQEFDRLCAEFKLGQTSDLSKLLLQEAELIPAQLLIDYLREIQIYGRLRQVNKLNLHNDTLGLITNAGFENAGPKLKTTCNGLKELEQLLEDRLSL